MDDPASSWAVPVLAVVVAAAILFTAWASAVASRHSLGAKGNFYVIKYWIAYIMVEIQNFRSRQVTGGIRKGDFDELPTKLTDRPQELLTDGQALDSAYFCGFDDQGNWLVARLCRRQNNECEIWLSLHITGDGLYESPVHPHTQILDDGKGNFSAGNLTFEVLEDFRRWRITFNGPMRRKIESAESGKQEDSNSDILPHVKFAFIWEALTDVYCSDSDLDTNLLAAAIAGESWSSKYFENLRNRHQTRYEQAGGFVGSITVDGGSPLRLRLRGFRDRSYGVREWKAFKRYISHFIVMENGMFIVFAIVDFPGCFSRIASGCIFMPNGERQVIDWTDLRLENVGENGSPPAHYCFQVSSGTISLKIRIQYRSGVIYYHGNNRTSMCLENVVDVTCDSHRGYGIAEFFYRNKENENDEVTAHFKSSMVETVDFLGERSSTECFVVSFDRDVCRDPTLVGGKAAQLGFLTKLQKQEKFTVPYGICLTKCAFEKHVNENQAISDSLQNLQLAASGQLPGCDLATACNEVTSKIKATSMKRELQLAITEAMIRAFKQEAAGKLFAVRSSAVGEDGAELSSAGQMDTLLGVKGDPQSLSNAVLSCWASQYTAQAVEYKRQYGQAISNGMGVVIQEMVPSDTSGVLFTRDPISGNPSVMVINANFGLGESVVSGLSEPDNIKIARLPSGQLMICDKHIGTKVYQTKIKAGGGTLSVNDCEASSVCCLTDEDVLRLCNIGLKLEEQMGGGRDIEWALFNGNVYLLQARPITTNDQPDDFEILHEFDSPHSREDEFCTSANVGEMMPGAMTPLTITTFYRSLEMAMQTLYNKMASYKMAKNAHTICKISSGHAFLNLHAMEISYKLRNSIGDRRVLELSLLGQTVQGMTDEEVLSYNSTVPWYSRLKNAFTMSYTLWNAEARLSLWNERLDRYVISKSSESKNIYADICNRMQDLTSVWYTGLWGSAFSGVSFNVLISILTHGKPCYTMDSYHDVATLLSCCDNVISATVPVMLKEIAVLIAHGKDRGEFVAMSPTDATEWILSERSGNVGEAFRKFLEVHGHRCVREADMYERSWAQDPSRVVTTLQSMASVPDQAAASHTRLGVDELMKLLKTKLSVVGGMALRRVIPWAWQCVGRREWSKSLQIKMNDCFKQAYWALAGAMKREGRIPDEELLFFFTHAEIGALLRTRSAKIIARANKRRKLYPQMAQLSFSRDNAGHPIPIKSQHSDCNDVALEQSGMPVSLGTVRGRACVVLDLQSASALQNRDILIVPFTDIGWSPYFPIISGLVTEIGGLISHGAVVAREYGIPCIVNCPRATEIFNTGDLVELCGDSGTIKKLKTTQIADSDSRVNIEKDGDTVSD